MTRKQLHVEHCLRCGAQIRFMTVIRNLDDQQFPPCCRDCDDGRESIHPNWFKPTRFASSTDDDAFYQRLREGFDL